MTRVKLRVLDAVELVNTVPATRADCPTQRPCCHWRCKFWLGGRIDPENRQGRPGLARVPRNARGTTLSAPGHAGDERPATTLQPRWLTEPNAPTCAFDVIARGPQSASVLAISMGRHRTLVLKEIKRAVASLRARGVTLDDLRRLIAPERRVDQEPSKRATRRTP